MIPQNFEATTWCLRYEPFFHRHRRIFALDMKILSQDNSRSFEIGYSLPESPLTAFKQGHSARTYLLVRRDSDPLPPLPLLQTAPCSPEWEELGC